MVLERRNIESEKRLKSAPEPSGLAVLTIDIHKSRSYAVEESSVVLLVDSN